MSRKKKKEVSGSPPPDLPPEGGGETPDSAEYDSAEYDSAELDSAEYDSAELDSAELERVPGTALHRMETEDPGERPSAWQRHDLLVVIGALALLAAGVFAYRSLTTPQLERFSRFGLSLERPSAWLPPRPVTPSKSRLAIAVTGKRDATGERNDTDAADLPYHVVFQSPNDPLTRLEIRIAPRPVFRNLRGALSLARVNRYGNVYWPAESGRETIDGRDWVRTRFRYAYRDHPGDSPAISSAIEYATLNGKLVYVVTFHGSQPEAERLRALLAPSLSVNANHPAATGHSKEGE